MTRFRFLLPLLLVGIACPSHAQFSLGKLKETLGKAKDKAPVANPANNGKTSAPDAEQDPDALLEKTSPKQSAAGEVFFATAPLELGSDGKPHTVNGQGRITKQFTAGEWIYGLIVLQQPIKELVGKAANIPAGAWRDKETIDFDMGLRAADAPSTTWVPRWYMEHTDPKANKKALSVAIFVPADQAKKSDVWSSPWITNHFRDMPTQGTQVQEYTFRVMAGGMGRSSQEVILAKGRIEIALNAEGRKKAEDVKKGASLAKAADVRMPKADRKDPKLEAELKRVWEAYSNYSKVLRVVLSRGDWESFFDNNGSKKSKLSAHLATKGKGGEVECTRVQFERPWTGSGWGAIRVAGIGDTFAILEENVQK